MKYQFQASSLYISHQHACYISVLFCIRILHSLFFFFGKQNIGIKIHMANLDWEINLQKYSIEQKTKTTKKNPNSSICHSVVIIQILTYISLRINISK